MKKHYKAPKNDGTNRKVALWSGKPVPIKVIPPRPQFTESEWTTLVKQNEKPRMKPKKK